jgi:two-component system response regulator ChvI
LNLEDSGFDVVAFEGGTSALAWFARGERADIILLDVRMPGMDGFQVLDRLRMVGVETPVVFLTAVGDDVHEERALSGGAVDFVDKSRRLSILIKRLQRILESSTKPGAANANEAPQDGVVRLGHLELHEASCRVSWRGTRIDLTLSEYQVVRLIAMRRGADVSYRDIYDVVRGKDFVAGQGPQGYRANVRALIKRIRKKFRAVDPDCDPIANYPGYGYRWAMVDG